MKTDNMKLTLWQQFGSNHSNSFTLVGVFNSPEEAQKAAERLRDFLNRYIAWVEAHPDEAQQHYYDDEPAPPEADFYAREGIEVNRSIVEWIIFLEGFTPLDDVLYAYENVLLMDSDGENGQKVASHSMN